MLQVLIVGLSLMAGSVIATRFVQSLDAGRFRLLRDDMLGVAAPAVASAARR